MIRRTLFMIAVVSFSTNGWAAPTCALDRVFDANQVRHGWSGGELDNRYNCTDGVDKFQAYCASYEKSDAKPAKSGVWKKLVVRSANGTQTNETRFTIDDGHTLCDRVPEEYYPLPQVVITEPQKDIIRHVGEPLDISWKISNVKGKLSDWGLYITFESSAPRIEGGHALGSLNYFEDENHQGCCSPKRLKESLRWITEINNGPLLVQDERNPDADMVEVRNIDEMPPAHILLCLYKKGEELEEWLTRNHQTQNSAVGYPVCVESPGTVKILK